jgi:lysophospholipase L1-like esterase
LKRHPRAQVAALAVAGALLLGACSTDARSRADAGGPVGSGGAGRVAVTPKATPTPTPAPPKGPYVALGDSYTSGPRIPDQLGTPTGCARSSRNYPRLVARALGLPRTAFRDVSCSGATTAQLSASQPTTGGVNPAQLNALTADTRLVTVGIGGNDVGFTDLLTRCVEEGLMYSLHLGSRRTVADQAPCRAYYTHAGTDTVQLRLEQAGKRLALALGEVRRRSPHASVYVVGYPALFPASGGTCTAGLGLAGGDVLYLHQKEQQLNAMLRSRALAAGARYVDTYTPSVGRDACAAPATRWIEPLLPSAPAAPVHPNERGERGMAEAVLRAVRVA